MHLKRERERGGQERRGIAMSLLTIAMVAKAVLTVFTFGIKVS